MAFHRSLVTLLISQLWIFSLGSAARTWGISHLKLTANSTFDYIVVGGGTAGLTMASRLSEQPSVRVAVVEAGDFPEDENGNQSQVPAYDAYFNGKDRRATGPGDWGFTTIPQAVSTFAGFTDQNNDLIICRGLTTKSYIMHGERE